MSEDKNPVVWKLQEPPPPARRDYNSALEFGDICEVLTPYEHPSKTPEYCLLKMHTEFQEFQEGDYLLFGGGDPLTPLFAGIVLANLGFSEFNWLKWDRNQQEPGGYYTPVRIDLESLKKMVDFQNFQNEEN